jgi:hypothetical protein
MTLRESERRQRQRDTAIPTRLPRPKFATIKTACAYGGIGKSKLYQKSKQVPGLLVKWDDRTLVNMDIFDKILDGLPFLHEQS